MLYSHSKVISEESHYLEPSQNLDQQPQYGPCSLLDIPSETLTGITSYLDPPSLFCLAKVNTALSHHVKDDNTWRRAFATRYLGIGPHDDWYNNGARTILLRRSENSWRNEFIARFKLERNWESSRSASISHVPVPSAISSIHLMPCQVVLSSCLNYGIVARSLPFSGKVYSGYLSAAADGMGLGGIGNPNLEFAPNASTCAITSKGGSASILWGFLDGSIAVILAERVMNPMRITTELKRCRLHEEHQGAVSDSVWNVDGVTAVTGGLDGQVKLWLVNPLECVWTSEGRVHGAVPDACLKVAVATNQGYIIAAFNSGEILLWTGFEVENIRSISATEIKQIHIPCPLREFKQDVNPVITSLHIEASAKEAVIVLIAYKDHPYLYRIRVANGDGNSIEVTVFGDPSFGPIRSVSPYFGTPPEHGSFVIAGDRLGYINIYDWRSVQVSQGLVRPIRKFEAYEDGAAVTAIAWNGVTLMTGSSRGTIHVWDGLNFTRLRSFVWPSSRRHRHHPQDGEVDDGSVKQIILDTSKEMFIACAYDRVLAWRVGASDSTGKRRGQGYTARKNKNGYSKYLEQLEMKETIKESRKMVEQENESYKRAFNREKEHRAKLEKLGLTETEALEYALMLSREEAIERGARDEIESDVSLASDDIDESYEMESSLRRASTTSDQTWSQTYGSPYPRVNVSAPVIQASPSSSSISSVPSTSSSLSTEPAQLSGGVHFPPIASTPSASPPNSIRGRNSDIKVSPTEESAISSGPSGSKYGTSVWNGSSKTWFAGGSSTTSKKSTGKSWSSVAGSSSTSASGSERFRPVGARGIKYTSSKFHAGSDAELDEDLRYAIELSLAEAQSEPGRSMT